MTIISLISALFKNSILLLILILLGTTACFEIVIDSVKPEDISEENLKEINLKSTMALKIITDENETQICTATLIDPSFLISVAHCFDQGAVYVELLPTINEQKIVNEIIGIPVHAVYIHPDYDSQSGKNDLALIKVDPEQALIQTLSPITFAKAKASVLANVQVLQVAYQKTQIEKIENEMPIMVDALKQTIKISPVISAQDDTVDLIEDASSKPCAQAGTAIITLEKGEEKLLGLGHQGNLNCVDGKGILSHLISDFNEQIINQTDAKAQFTYVNADGELNVELSCGQILNCSTRQCTSLKVSEDDQPLITALKECLVANMCQSTNFKCGQEICANQYQACQAN
jgi:hypothetical protein